MEMLTKENLVGAETAPTAISMTFTALARETRFPYQEVLNPTPLNPTPAACHKRKRKLRCSFWNAALQKLHCNIRFSAVRTSFVPKAALQRTKNCTATSKSLRCRKVALSCRFPAGFKPPRLGTHVSDLLTLARIHFSRGSNRDPENHWTAPEKKSMTKSRKDARNCRKIYPKSPASTIFGHVSDIFAY